MRANEQMKERKRERRQSEQSQQCAASKQVSVVSEQAKERPRTVCVYSLVILLIVGWG